jgi:Fe(3+) dicitrate transport protein
MITTYLRSIAIPLVFLIVPASSLASDTSGTGIKGRVLSSGEGVPFVTVFADRTSLGTSTDEEGNYILLGLPAGSYAIRVQGVGYRNIEKKIVLEEGIFMEVDFILEQDAFLMEQVTVSGSRVGLLRYLPGSAASITRAELKTSNLLNGNEILRTVTGIHVVEEEGAGLRTNIGVRGLDPDKSRNVLILEDGIPVALGPYGEPEMYYTPAIDRMSGVEILKGSGSILFGPQTIGGVINYITADPPAESSGFVRINGGERGLFSGQMGYGNTFGNTGYQFNYLRRQAENLGPTQFASNDLNAKFRLKTSARSEVMVKLGVYDENSNSTYIGMTQLMYNSGGTDYIRLAPDDRLEIKRHSLGVNHVFRATDDFQLSTTAYAYNTVRNWKRQDFTSDPNASNLTGVVWGDSSIPGGAIYMVNSTGNRNRQFEVAGIESRMNVRYSLMGRESLLNAGTRLHYERAFEQRVNGSTADAVSGALRDDEIRTGNAMSFWTQNKLLLNRKLSFTAGVRSEFVDYERNILRKAAQDVNIINNTRVREIIPGMGLNYNFSDRAGIFTGIHRGFAPPRIKDAITNNGEDLLLEAEKSWNFEIGTRAELLRFTGVELTFFNMDFSNQVIPVSESSGGMGTGYINGGRTRHRGIEAELNLDIAGMISMPGRLSVGLNGTFLESVFAGDRFVIERIPVGGINDTVLRNIKGNHTPYAPTVIASGYIHYESARGFGMRAGGHFTGSQYTDVLNTECITDWQTPARLNPEYTFVQANASGRIGKLPSYFVVNTSAWYNLGAALTLNVSVKNMFNERYITSRRPQGIRVGLPRMFSGGLTYNF